MSYADVVLADMRLMILRLLSDDPNWSHNDRVLQKSLAAMGHARTKAEVRDQCVWLRDQSAIAIEELNETVWIVTLTERGADAARGLVTINGVDRPTPRHT